VSVASEFQKPMSAGLPRERGPMPHLSARAGCARAAAAAARGAGQAREHVVGRDDDAEGVPGRQAVGAALDDVHVRGAQVRQPARELLGPHQAQAGRRDDQRGPLVLPAAARGGPWRCFDRERDGVRDATRMRDG